MSLSNEPVVFIVDDAPAVLAALAALLDVSGFRVKTFVSAEDFLASFEPEQRGCLLLDVRLPGMTGVELLKKLQAASVKIPVILMSGHASNEVRKDGMANGALAFLDKPVQSRQLIEILSASFDNV